MEKTVLEQKETYVDSVHRWGRIWGLTLLVLIVAYPIAVRLDLLMGTNYLRDAVCIAFIANEALSILENAGLMGMPIPEVLRQAIDILNGKAEKYTESRGER